MCLHLLDNSVLKAAEEDITCYKVGKIREGKFTPYHRLFRYLKGVTTSPVKIVPMAVGRFVGEEVVFEGYHSFVDKSLAVLEAGEFNDVGVFIIPKGVKYIKGSDNGSSVEAYVSEQLKWVDTIDWKYRLKEKINKWIKLWNSKPQQQ